MLQVTDENARAWYENEASKQTWSVRTMQRNISSQYFSACYSLPPKTRLINHLPQFLMEMGKGFAFVDRQKHIHTEKNDY